MNESFRMNRTDIRNCLRDLQVVATVPHLSDERIAELLKLELIERSEKTGGIRLTQLGVHTKTGEI